MFKLIKLFIFLVVVAVVVAFFSINPIIKKGITTVGPMVLDVPVSLEKSNISFSGRGELQGLKVGNPKGFDSAHLFDLNLVTLDVNLLSIAEEVLHIREITIDTPHVIYEGDLSNSNVKTLLKTLEGDSQPAEPSTDSPEQPSEKQEGKEKKMIIDHILIKDIKVGYSNKLLGGKEINFTLPTIEKRDLGKAEGGQTPSEMVKSIVKEINRSILEQIKKQGGNVGNLIQDLDDELKKGDVKESLNKAADKLKGLFGK